MYAYFCMKIKTTYRQVRDDFSLKNNKLYKQIADLEPLSVANTIPLTWAKAVDFSVWDDKGNKFIDLTSGIFVANAGHSNPRIKKAIKDQVDADMLFAYNYPTKIKYQFLKKLLAASRHFNCATLLNSGSEAVDIAYKLIKLYGTKTKKKYIVTFGGGYHGRGLSNDLIAGSKQKAAWSGMTDETVCFLDFPYDPTAKFDPSILPPHKEIAGFVIETFQGWGAWFFPDGFLNDLSKFAKKHRALVCFDELQSGFYRLGPIYGYMTYGKDIVPDLVAVGKGISSSLPISALLGNKKIMNIDPKADLHGTHSGNAVSCASALANLEFLSSSKQVSAQKKTMKVFGQEMKSFEKSPMVRQVNVRGMIAALIFEKTEDATRVVKECIMNGVLPVCTNRNSIKIAPPLTITAAAIREASDVIRNALGITL